MAKVWYCRNCGYEVRSRGRCHSCGDRLIASAMPELAPGREEDEVGYRLDDWTESDRGRLIERLNDLGVVHRFEEEELVVDAGDEDRVDDLVAMLADISKGDLEVEDDYDAGVPVGDRDLSPGEAAVLADEDDDSVAGALKLLASAAARLQADPTDMQADADVAEASAAVFTVNRFGSLDEDAWLAVGRVTRRLLSLLGADEAMEEGIRSEAAILSRLLAPVDDPGAMEVEGEKTVYELAEWTHEQRARLGVLLAEEGIGHQWDGDDLLVPADREDDVEALFDRVAGPEEAEGDDEERYRAVEELFAACGRLAGDPTDEQRRAAVVDWYGRCAGPPLLGMSEVDWFRIMSRAKTLASAIESDADADHVMADAQAVHDLLRSVV